VRLAKHFHDRPLVWFGLMNEPNKHTAQLNAQLMQSAVNAIRATGAKNFITVPGTSWTGAHSWISSGNAAAYENFSDPGSNFAFEVHQYLDKDNSGSHAEATSGAGAKRIAAFAAWAKTRHVRGLLGETGWSKDDASQAEGEAELAAMDQDRDVWLGFTYWAAGPWWGSYMYSLEPEFPKIGDPVDKPQMAVVAKHLR
jgi:endoglucanase